MKIIEDAVLRGEKTLSEFDSKKVLEAYSIPVTRENIAKSLSQAKDIAGDIGYPVALKGSASTLTHKTELNMVACACGMWPDDFIDAVLAPRARRAPQMSGEDFAAAINFLGNLAIDRGLLRYGPRYEA